MTNMSTKFVGDVLAEKRREAQRFAMFSGGDAMMIPVLADAPYQQYVLASAYDAALARAEAAEKALASRLQVDARDASRTGGAAEALRAGARNLRDAADSLRNTGRPDCIARAELREKQAAILESLAFPSLVPAPQDKGRIYATVDCAPTKADADYQGWVMAWDVIDIRWVCCQHESVAKFPARFTHWRHHDAPPSVESKHS